MSKYLIIDDNPSITKMLSAILTLEGHTTVIANDGRNGLSLIESQKFDGIILDLAMPRFSGYDVIDKLESNGKLKENKIIILTASETIESETDALKKRGIHSVLQKPIDSDILLNLLNN